MTKDKALKLALECIEAWDRGGNASDYWRDRFDAITAIKEALAQPEQEPYGYFQFDLRLDAWVQNRDSNKGVAFYTTPPQRKPLTDEEIDVLVMDSDGTPNSHLEFARAIEAAHGIKE